MSPKIHVPLCVYCQRRPGGTADHVPPKLLFPVPRPSDLVTVPCCAACRRRQQTHDEYLRTIIGMRHDFPGHPAAKDIIPRIRRSLERPQARRFAQAIMRGTRYVSINTPAGLRIGTAPAVDVNLARLCRTVERYTVGLWYREFDELLPPGTVVSAFELESSLHGNPAFRDDIKEFVRLAVSGRARDLGPGVYEYWVARADEDVRFSVWLHRVYERVAFIVLTMPEGALAALEAGGSFPSGQA